MNHLYIFGLIINLIIGSVIYTYALQTYRRNYSTFPKAFLNYIVFFNILVSAYFITRYLATNVFINVDSSSLSTGFKIFFISRIALFIVGEFGIALTIYRVSAFLKGQKPSALIQKILFGLVGLFIILYSFAFFNFFKYHTFKYLKILDMIWEWLINLIIILIAGQALKVNKSSKKPKKGLKNFGVIFLFAYLVYSFPHLIYYIFGKSVGYFLDPIILILINILSFIWIRNSYHSSHISPEEIQKIKGTMEDISIKFSISKREQEIIQCILDGKSNQEICDELYLSFHTVKNHIYSIFKKFNIKSRSQLIHLINQDLK